MKKTTNPTTKGNRFLSPSVLSAALVLLLIISIIPHVIATTPTPMIQLPNGPVSIIVFDGSTAYFDIDVSDVPLGFDIEDGWYEGWCADWSVTMPRGEQLTVRLYNSYSSPLPAPVRNKNWEKINYILNHQAGVSKTDVQNAFWHILCNAPYSTLSEKAQQLVDTAQDGFIPQPGDLIAIIAQPIQNNSNPWPFQISFIQVQLPFVEEPDDEEPIPVPTRRSHGLHYNDIPPVADANGPYNGLSRQEIVFDGSHSYDPDGIIILYTWDFGDGTTIQAKKAIHTYTHPGVYHIALTVRDNFGIQDTDTTTVTIITPNNPPQPPLISGLANGTVNTVHPYTFGTTDPENDALTYHIDWGDGTAVETVNLPSAEHFGRTHQWTSPGAYTITVIASDGELSAVSEKDVTIHENQIVDNIWLIGLALLAVIILLAILIYEKTKNKK